jgi:hypothetical protein
MKRYFLWGSLVLLLATPLYAQQQAVRPKVVLDVWDAVYLDGAKMGHQRTTVEERQQDGQTIYHTTRYLHLTLKRYDGIVTQRMALSTEETPEGEVVGVSMTHYLDQDRKIVQSGRVEGDKLRVRTPSDPDGKAVPWDKDGVLGYYAQERLFQQRKVKAGDRFRFRDYQLPLLRAVALQVVVKGPEEKELLATQKDGAEVKAVKIRKRLLRVEESPEKVTVNGATIPLPRLTVWLDEKLQPVRQESSTPLGRMTLYRTSRILAEKAGMAPELMADFGLNSRIRLPRPIERPFEAREIVYRITVQDDDEPTTTFARDKRQSVENVHGDTFDLRVRAIREPAEVETPGKVEEEFLKSSYFLDCGNAKVREQAAQIVGDEMDPWRKAQRIEKWVHEHMQGNPEVNFAPASQVLRDLQGDCRQHAMLTAALCRAAGIPARTAVGLVYDNDRKRGPGLAFHMWTEVWIKGQWLMLDAVLGHGHVGAAHLKIADHSWQDIQTLAPLLPVTRVTGKVRIDVVEVK